MRRERRASARRAHGWALTAAAAMVTIAAAAGCSRARGPIEPRVPAKPAGAVRSDDPAVHMVRHAAGTCPLCDLYGAAREHVVRILTNDGLGAGVVVTSDGLVVTNAHVVAGAMDVDVETAGGRTYRGRVLVSDAAKDLALVRTESAGVAWTPAAVVDGGAPRVGSSVYVIGHPVGFGWSVTRGIVSAVRAASGLPSMIQTDAPLSPGNSGGPLLDPDGHLLGIVTSKAHGAGAQNLGFARPAAAVVEILVKVRVPIGATAR